MQRLIAVALTLLLSHTPVAFAADSLRESAMRAAGQLRAEGHPQRRVELLGVGAAVEVRLANGQKLDGSITSIDSGSFALSFRHGEVRRITYGEVAESRLVSAKASGPPKVTEAKRVAAGLGAGRHVAVKMTSGQTFRGHIQTVHEEHLVLLRDQATIPIDIAYEEVQALGPGPAHQREKRDLDRRGGSSADCSSYCGNLRLRVGRCGIGTESRILRVSGTLR